jgi:hypothetical protein
MNFRLFLSDSFTFTRETFFGNPARGVIFLLLGISMGFFFSAKNIIPHLGHFRICWQIVDSWWVWGILLIIFWLTYTLLEGYQVRIFRNSVNPPVFDKGKLLIKEGLIAEILIVIWSVPAFVWIFISSSPLILILLLVLPALIYPVSLYLYANSKNFLEGLRIPKILSAIKNPGWGNYLAAWGIVVVCFLVIVAINAVLRIFLVLVPSVPVPLTSAIKYGFFGYSIAFFHVFTTRFLMNVLKGVDEKEALDTAINHVTGSW